MCCQILSTYALLSQEKRQAKKKAKQAKKEAKHAKKDAKPAKQPSPSSSESSSSGEASDADVPAAKEKSHAAEEVQKRLRHDSADPEEQAMKRAKHSEDSRAKQGYDSRSMPQENRDAAPTRHERSNGHHAPAKHREVLSDHARDRPHRRDRSPAAAERDRSMSPPRHSGRHHSSRDHDSRRPAEEGRAHRDSERERHADYDSRIAGKSPDRRHRPRRSRSPDRRSHH